jgi:hypothetical protein
MKNTNITKNSQSTKQADKILKKVQIIDGLPKIIEGKGKNQKVYHYIKGQNYKNYPAKKLNNKEPFTGSILIAVNPRNKELSFKVYWTHPVNKDGVTKFCTGCNYFSIDYHGIMKAQLLASSFSDEKMLKAFRAKHPGSWIPDSCLFGVN